MKTKMFITTTQETLVQSTEPPNDDAIQQAITHIVKLWPMIIALQQMCIQLLRTALMNAAW